MDYGRAIRVTRSARGLTQTELAKRLTIGPSQLSLLESGKRQPTMKVINEIADALRVPLHLLMLLASDRDDLKRREDEPEMNELAKALLRLLVTPDTQANLPLNQ